jgi:murein DD-endopeptidase MepM/ murein hydrolase activator NlpD
MSASQNYALGGTGGLVGLLDGGGIQRSFASGTVQGGSDNLVGGLVGWATDGKISQSNAIGAVSAQSSSTVGGLVARMGGNIGNPSVDQAYSVGAVAVGSGGLFGGLIGYDYGSGNVTNSYWDTQTSGTNQSAGGKGLTTNVMQDGSLRNEGGFDPSVWEPMLTDAVQPAAAYYPQLWALSFPVTAFPLAGQEPYGNKKSNPPGAGIITLFDHSLRTSSQAGIGGNPLTAALYGASCDDAVLAFSGQIGLQQYGQDTTTCDEAGYEQDSNGDKFDINGINYVGDASDRKNGHTPTQYLNYEGHPGIDFGAKYVPVYAAASGIVFYPYRAVGSGKGKTNYDTYCRFHTLAEIPDSAAAYRIYYLHLRTHPNGLGLQGFPPDPSCKINKYNSPGQQVPITPVTDCYTLNGQTFMPATLPLPPNVHANAGCQIAVSGDAGVPGAPHLHFEIQQIVPSAAISPTTAAVIKNFLCWNENNQYKGYTSSYCLPQDPYGWTYPTTACGDVSQWPPNGTYITDDWACLSSVPSQRFWAP